MRNAMRLPVLALAILLIAAGCGSDAATPSASTGPSAAVTSAPTSAPATPTAAPSASAAPGSACTTVTAPAAKDWNTRTWYEVFVRSFKDASGDGIGDIKGLTSQLDYLNDGDPATTTDLGVGGLWLMPIAKSPSYHGYDVIDYRKVQPDYGTLADVQALIKAAHQRGIKVIVDFVPNHTSSQNPWFKDAQTAGSKHDDWYVWSDTSPGWLGPSGQTVWHPLAGRYFYGVFWDGMPDLNLRNPKVTAELEDIARYWLSDVGVDGFRVDAAKHLIEDGKTAQTNTPETKAWLAGFKSSIDGVNPDAMVVGEVWDPASIAGAYVPDSLDMTFDFGMAEGIRSAIQQGRAAPIVTALSDAASAWPANQNATFLTNHDQDRIMSQLGGDVPSAKLAAFLLETVPGTPFLYYGEEIGMSGRKPDEIIRTPMRWTEDPVTGGFTTGTPWEGLSADPAGTSVAAQTGDPASLLSAYRTMIRVRSTTPELETGATVPVEGGAEPVISWLRTLDGRTVLVVANMSDQPVSEYGLALRSGPLCGPVIARILATIGGDVTGSPAAVPVTAGGGLEAWKPFPVLPPRSGYVLSLESGP